MQYILLWGGDMDPSIYRFMLDGLQLLNDRIYIAHHFGLFVDLTMGVIPSLYSDFVLLKLTMLNITR